jgi:glucose/mannose-6-phosphate isomerase
MATDSYIALVERLPEHMAEAKALGDDVDVSDVDNVVISGMGGSAIAGNILQAYVSERAPGLDVRVSRGYDLPAMVNKRTLVLAVSYSGNTEESLSSFRAAIRKGAKIAVITSGGKLKKQAEELNKPLVVIPQGIQPRAALPFVLVPILNILSNSGLIPDPTKEIESTISSLKAASEKYKEKAMALAEKLIGKVPIVYSSERISGVSFRWKTQFNENSKIHAFSHVFSELNHNELAGYTKLNANYYVIMLEDEADNRRIKERIRLTKEIIGAKGVPSIQVVIRGEQTLTRLMSSVHIGDLTSVYLAKLTGIDPEPVDIIEEFKARLNKVPFV